jgi:hypothetical protein
MRAKAILCLQTGHIGRSFGELRIDLLDDIDERPPVGRFWRLECGNIRVWFAPVAVRLAELLAVVGDKPKARFLPVRLPDASEYVSIRMASPTLFFER